MPAVAQCGTLSTHTTAPAGRLVFLDYLRIFAFASVFAGHKFSAPVQAAAREGVGWQAAAARVLWPFIEGGGAGVVVFFLVSGYIITHVLQRERTPEFLLKRAFRIYPLYVVAVLADYSLLLAQRGSWPPAHTLLPQLLLIGDLRGTPYALNGVEWTLRLEVTFYLLMAGCQMLGLVQARRGRALALLFAGLVVLLHASPPFPTHTEWSNGYLSLYLPFLLLGAVWWLFEQRVLGALALALFVAGLLVLYRLGLQAWAPRWQHAWFAELALALFALLWWLRHRLRAPAWVLGLSELTYAVYLLHTWLFDIGRDALLAAGAGRAAADLAGVAGVLATSWLLVRLVERPGIALGRRLARPLGWRPGLRRA